MVSEACEGDDNRSGDGDLVSVIQSSREVRGERLRGGVVPSLSEPLPAADSDGRDTGKTAANALYAAG